MNLRLLNLNQLVFATHDMSWHHVERWQAVPFMDRPNIKVERLGLCPRTGNPLYFVHDGRHRATAAYEDDRIFIFAEEVDVP